MFSSLVAKRASQRSSSELFGELPFGIGRAAGFGSCCYIGGCGCPLASVTRRGTVPRARCASDAEFSLSRSKAWVVALVLSITYLFTSIKRKIYPLSAVCCALCTAVQHSGCRTSICGSAVGCVTLRAELCRFVRVTQCVRTPTNHRPVFLHFLPFCGMYFLTHFSFLSIKQLFTAPDDIVLQLPQVYPRPACQSAANSASVSAAARASSGHCENQ